MHLTRDSDKGPSLIWPVFAVVGVGLALDYAVSGGVLREMIFKALSNIAAEIFSFLRIR